MIRDIFLAAIVLTISITLFWGFVSDFTAAAGGTIDPASAQQYQNLSSSLNNTYSSVSSYANAGYAGVAGVSTNPAQTEGQDIISVMGRFATSVVKTFINAFTIPIELTNAFSVALGIPVAYGMIAAAIGTMFAFMVILEILSIATRYPLDR